MSGAPLYSLAEDPTARAESAAWNSFVAPGDDGEFSAAWLALLCARVERARAALLLVGDDERGPFSVAAAWPDPQRDLQYLGPAAQRALAGRVGVVVGADGGPPAADGAAHVGYPIEVSGRLFGAVVLDIAAGAPSGLQSALRQVHWASGWLVDHFRQRLLQRREAELARVGTLNALMATALQHHRLQASALAVANELAGRLSCDRVSVGFESGGRIEPVALSHTASFDARSDLVRAIGDAMDETLDLGVALSFPAQDEVGAIAHADAARALGVQAMLSVPLTHSGQTLGVITLERNAGPEFDEADRRIATAAGVMLGPVWSLQRTSERGFVRRTLDRLRETAVAVAGPQHPGLKVFGGLAAAALLVIALVHVDHRVAARTVIEGSVQIASVAPFEGFIAAGFARAGDTVRQGQPLARLDDRDLKLERARWLAEREQLRKRFQVAMAGADRGAMGVLAAQINQAQAQFALAEERLSRATLVAPFDGVVVSGDLSQQIGTPVEQGKLLFEVAPLEGYRVVLQVDDRDIAWLAQGQRGELVLSSLPDRKLPFAVRTITPVASQYDGRNVFRVEAHIDGERPQRLRPGMEGIGKIVVGRRSLFWIWTHGFFDWLRLSVWNWMP